MALWEDMDCLSSMDLAFNDISFAYFSADTEWEVIDYLLSFYSMIWT